MNLWDALHSLPIGEFCCLWNDIALLTTGYYIIDLFKR